MKLGMRSDPGASAVKILLALLLLLSVTVTGVVAWQTRDSNKSPTMKSSTTPEVSSSNEPTAATNKKGTFSGVAPKSGAGSVILAQNAEGNYVVRLGDDFTVQEGPDLYVSFGNNDEVDHDTLFSTLNAFSGAQEYTVPDTIDVSKYGQVIIYCREFSVVFSYSPLQ